MPSSLNLSRAAGNPSTLIVADDLTGACDAGVAFAERGLETRVALSGGWTEGERATVCAVSTGSRDLPPAEGETVLTELARRPEVASFGRLFKKIDSVFRGNTAREIATAARVFEADVVLVAPAYPKLGRTVVDGVIRVSDLHGKYEIPGYRQVRDAGLEAELLRVGGDAGGTQRVIEALALEKPGAALFCDAEEQADLQEIAQAGLRSGLRVLWVGAGGLAHALAGELAGTQGPVNGRGENEDAGGCVLLFVGSEHPVSARQLAHLHEQMDVEIASEEAIAPRAGCGALLFPVRCGTTREEEIARFSEGLRAEEIGCVFMTGGDTAALVSRALGVRALTLEREFAPGLAQGRLVGGRWSGCRTVLKSGGFGEAGTMLRVVESFVRQEAKHGTR